MDDDKVCPILDEGDKIGEEQDGCTTQKPPPNLNKSMVPLSNINRGEGLSNYNHAEKGTESILRIYQDRGTDGMFSKYVTV